jgi:hypothetical protein
MSVIVTSRPFSQICLTATLIALLATDGSSQTQSLVDWHDAQIVSQAVTSDASALPEQIEGVPSIILELGHKAPYPGLTIRGPENGWDLSNFTDVVATIENLGEEPTTMFLRVDGPGGDGVSNSITRHVELQPGQTSQLHVPLPRRLPAQLAPKLFGMRGYPGGAQEGGIDVAHVTQLILFVSHPATDAKVRVIGVSAEGHSEEPAWRDMSEEQFFPMIDRFGQFIHNDWPHKTRDEEGLRRAHAAERELLDRIPGPDGWNEYGGWEAGPRVPATRYFCTMRYKDRWWLVDPTGRVFWSHGVDCVGFGYGATPITDREFYFAELPPKEPPYRVFYGSSNWAPHGYYKDHTPYETFGFFGVNLFRKYGENWRAAASDTMHRRLRSWSLNTIGNWSDADIYLQRKTPYVATLGTSGAARIEGSSGYWGKFPDPYDPSFRRELDRGMAYIGRNTKDDPWCVGYFIDNELAWGDEVSLAKSALASPAKQPAKQAFVRTLKKDYVDISSLNKAWETDYASWDEVAQRQELPDDRRARADLEKFYSQLAEHYFKECADAVRAVAPNHLYLGCRFSSVNDRAVRAAAKYSDVLTYNLYRDSISDFALPEGVDRPVLVGEFHFGALDRGMFHTGLRPTTSQQARAAAYTNYVTGALRHRQIVGTHWFQYADQATTGRGDGENYQIGFVDICDTPYPETIDAVRAIGAQMYPLRFNSP